MYKRDEQQSKKVIDLTNHVRSLKGQLDCCNVHIMELQSKLNESDVAIRELLSDVPVFQDYSATYTFPMRKSVLLSLAKIIGEFELTERLEG
jgi:uncharacterized coiled-coil DUF342 family protein